MFDDNSNKKQEIVGWIYKFPNDVNWKLWTTPEKPTHIMDIAQCMALEMLPVELSGFTSVTKIDSHDYPNTAAFCEAFNRMPAETIVHTTADLLQRLYKGNQAESIEILKDCRKYIQISESYERSLRELQNSIYEIIGYDGETDVLQLNDGKKLEGPEAKELISRLQKITQDVNEYISTGKNILHANKGVK